MRPLLEARPWIARWMIGVLMAASLVVAVPDTADARVCPDGTINVNGHCTVSACNWDLDNGTFCYPEPPVSPPSSCDERYAYLSPSLTIKGSVLGPGSAPVPQACVYWVDPQGRKSSVLTDQSGAFSISVPANLDNSPTTLIARKDFMTWDSKEIIPTEWADPARRVQMSLAYTQSVIVTPREFNSSVDREIALKVISAAPTTSRVLAEPVAGSVLTLSKDDTYTGPAPLSRWVTTFTVAAGTTEGIKTFPSCILSSAGTGTCEAPGSDIVYAPIPPVGFRGLYVVDNTAPSMGPVAPKDLHNTVDTTPSIWINPLDSLSGPNADRTQIWLDGGALGAGSWREPQSPLSLGVHSVTATIWDLAGNSSVVSWRFAVTALEGGPATVTVTPKTVSVPPQGLPGFCCQYVNFSNIQTQLSSYDVDLTSSPLWAGSGSGYRYVAHQNLKVTFKSAAQERTVPIVWAFSSYRVDIAVLEPSQHSLGVNLPEQISAIPDVGVYVPQGFIVTNDTTATVWAAVESLVTSTVTPLLDNDPIPDAHACSLNEDCIVEGAVSCRADRSAPGTDFDCNGTYPRATLRRQGEPPFAVLSLIARLNAPNFPFVPDSSTIDKIPDPNPAAETYVPPGSELEVATCNTQDYECKNALGTQPDFELTSYWATGGLFRAYANHHVITVSPIGGSPSHLLSWQASDFNTGVASCRSAKVVSFGHSVNVSPEWRRSSAALVGPGWPSETALQSSEKVGPLQGSDDGRFRYLLGAETDGNKLDLTSILFSGRLQGHYELKDNEAYSPTGATVTAASSGSRNSWRPASTYRDKHAEVMTATEFVPVAGVSTTGFALQFVMAFQITFVSVC